MCHLSLFRRISLLISMACVPAYAALQMRQSNVATRKHIDGVIRDGAVACRDHSRKACTNGVVGLVSRPPLEGSRAMNAKRTFEAVGGIPSPEFPTPADIERHLQQARRLRAEATSEMLALAARPLIRAARALDARIATWDRQRQTHKALMSCSNRVLADIGIAREDIPLVARGIDPRVLDAGATGWRRWWPATRVWLVAMRQAQRERRRIERELTAYRDHELDDLGIRRVDIPAIAHGRLPAAA
jgi:uncharacterized protein YjiS (DUF1127 family)